MAFPGLTPCPGGDCHGIDHAWCAPGKHAGLYDRLARLRDLHLPVLLNPKHRVFGA